MKPTTMPRILLVEDDPASRAFLAAAAEALPAVVDAAGDCTQARQLAAGSAAHDLWLLDANLPDGSGAGLLASLRAAAPQVPALAHTASHERADLDLLLAAGFLEVLVKPVAAQVLHGALRRALGQHAAKAAATATATATATAIAMVDFTAADAAIIAAGKLPNWDDAVALAALGGERAHVEALRRLFLDELPGQRQAVAAALAAGDVESAGRELHRLRAGCGFVGAARLFEAVHQLQARPRSAEALQRFDAAAGDLLAPG